MRRILPLLLALVGLGSGVGAGVLLRAPPMPDAPVDGGCTGTTPGPETAHGAGKSMALDHDYVKMNNQFVIPVIAGGRIKSLVVMSLSLEIAKGETEAVYAREPKLRDAFLRAMFDHANSGGFDGDFTANGNMAHLREALLNGAKGVLGEAVSDVLIVDIVRQDN